jgi:hypothetical protein
MVVGPITGEELPFPNTPVVDEEYQARNKFVYQWTDETRWKNIHRPLVISDYLWGSPEDPDEGDWVKEVITLPINGGGFITQGNFTSKTEPKFDAYSGPVTALYLVQDYGETEYMYPYQWVQALAQNMTGPRYTHQPLLIDNTFYYTNITFLDIGPSSRCRVVMPVSDLGDPSKLDEVTFKLTVSCKHVWLGGLDSVPFQNEFSIFGRNISQTGNGVTGGVGGDFGTMTRNQRIEGLSIQCQFPATNIGNQHWIVFELSQDASFYYYDVIIEIDDPYGPANANFIPMGFSTNSTLDRSMITFESIQLTNPPPNVLAVIRHNEPGTLAASAVEQSVESTTFRDITTKVVGDHPWTKIHYQDAGEAFVGLRSDTNVLEYRHMRIPYDITSTGDTVFDAEMDYDFTDFSSESPVITGEVKDLVIDPTGTYVYLLLDSAINRYVLSIPWDMSTFDPLTFTTLDVSSFAPQMFTVTFDGNVIVMGKPGILKQIILDTSFSLTGAIDTGFERAFDINDPVGITVSPDHKTMLMLDKPIDLTNGYQLIRYTKP